MIYPPLASMTMTMTMTIILVAFSCSPGSFTILDKPTISKISKIFIFHLKKLGMGSIVVWIWETQMIMWIMWVMWVMWVVKIKG